MSTFKESFRRKYGYYDTDKYASPGWDKYVARECDIVKMSPCDNPYSKRKPTATSNENLTIENILQNLAQSLSNIGWEMDISQAINADGKRGFIITTLPTK